MRGRVRRQLRHDQLRGFQGESPGAELLPREQAGQPGAPWGGREADSEVGDGGGDVGGDFLVHITQSGGDCYL
ncbi:hypothetical protein GCM10018980_62920 [Streptomyces capoamus]|uniref:Uncharacterized protein n=1 Tax=Streptomyces capoamus TaxID=68183 RepID=A0A919F1L3_9ACTN|nr:hypothetical protein GCM10010501_24170 [Streptomyces libani subsp. rufus]GHG68948.1 hypothetical protein GCM10018980_62920 [Streptomyces capoamus]